jgi:hypothetical protein
MSGRVAEGEFLRKKKWQRRFGGFAVGGNSDFIFSATVMNGESRFTAGKSMHTLIFINFHLF